MTDEQTQRHWQELYAAALYQPWEARKNNVLGGTCIQPLAEPTLEKGGLNIADMVSESHAHHIALVHNQWLRRRRSGIQYRNAYGLAMTGIVAQIIIGGTATGLGIYYHQPIATIVGGLLLIFGAVCGGLAYWKAEDGK